MEDEKNEFDTTKTEAEALKQIIDRDSMMQERGERFHAWFIELMEVFVSKAKILAETKGPIETQAYINEVEKLLFAESFMRNFPKPQDIAWLKKTYRESLIRIGLRMELGFQQTISFKKEKPSYILDKQPNRYENPFSAVEIGGGKIAARVPVD